MNLWHDLWGMYFYRIAEPSAWDDELQHTVKPSPDNAEISQVVRNMSSDDTLPASPKLKHLRMYIYKARNERAEFTRTETRDCDYCSDGWITHYDKDQISTQYPCLCSQGKRWRDKHYDPSTWEHFDDMARQAMKQKDERVAVTVVTPEGDNDYGDYPF